MSKIPSVSERIPYTRPLYNIKVSGGFSVRTRKPKSRLYDVIRLLLLVYFVAFITYMYMKRNEAPCELTNSNLLIKVNYLITSNQQLRDRVQFLEIGLINLRNNNSINREASAENDHAGTSPRAFRRQKRSDGNTAWAHYGDKKKSSCNRTEATEIKAVQFTSSDPNGFKARPLEGVLGPWAEHPDNGRNMEVFGVKLVEYNRKLEISRKGLYFIYSQVTYWSSNSANSYSIHVISGLDKGDAPISVCSSVGKYIAEGEVSCYTSVVRLLNAGDIVYLQQIEADRQINFYDTFTYFGVILLNDV